MIVVSDTSPLNYLVIIGAVDVLPQLFSDVYAPSSVVHELLNAAAPRIVREWAQTPPLWLRVQDPSERLASTARLHLGEAQAISLAKEMRIVDIMIDERRGRKIAAKEGLFPLPTLAVLERAAERNLVNLTLSLERLMRTTMRVPDELVAAMLRRDAVRRATERHDTRQS